MTATFTEDGTHILTDNGCGIQYWDIAAGTYYLKYACEYGGFHFSVLSPDGEKMLVVYENRFEIIDFHSLEKLGRVMGFTHLSDAVFYQDSEKFLLSDAKHDISTYNISDLKLENIWIYSTYESLKFSPDSKYLATLGHNLVLWDPETGLPLKLFRIFPHHSDYAFSHDAQSIFFVKDTLISNREQAIFQIDLETEKPLRKIAIPDKKNISVMETSNDGKYLVAATDDSLLIILDLYNDEVIVSDKMKSEVVNIDFSPDNNFIGVLHIPAIVYHPFRFKVYH